MYNDDDDDDVNGDVDMMHCSGAATGMDVFCSFGKRTYVTTSHPLCGC